MNSKNLKISVLLITRNEEKHIKEVIENVGFGDEIIIIDSLSTDKTTNIINTFKNVKLISRPFKNFTDQRNFAIKQAANNWILFIDADERIPKKLKDEILETVKFNNNINAYMFRRRFFFNKKLIKYSGLQSDTTYRLFKKGYAFYDEDKIVHERLVVKGKSAILKNHMNHYCFTTYENYKQKMILYAGLKARELYNNGKRANWLHFIVRPAYKFLTNYIFRLGFLDGKEGLGICYLSAYGVWYRYSELKRLGTLPKL